MDISGLKYNTGRCEIIDPLTGDKTDIVIEVYGVGSKVHKAAQFHAHRKLAALGADASFKNVDKIGNEMLAEITHSWENVQHMKAGKLVQIKLTEKAAITLYTESEIIKNQLDKFIMVEKNFLAGA